jgi:formate dehydrogenase subunit gamma
MPGAPVASSAPRENAPLATTAPAAQPAAAPAAGPVDPSPAMPNRPAAAGSPEVQSAAPEVGTGRGAAPNVPQQNAQTPASTEAPRPTGTPVAPPPQAAAPTPVAPIPAPPPLTARNQVSAEELELQRALQGGRIEGRITIPNHTAAVLVQPEGRDWRHFHNVTLAWVGGIAVGGMLLLLGLFYLIKGRMTLEEGLSGRTIQRFNWLERANHWMVASTFIILGLSGLNLTFGRYVLLPVFGPEVFYAATHYGKIAHNYLAFPFTLGLVVMLLLWVRDNIPDRVDVEWIKQAGGFIGSGHPPARRFNAGQKVVFWITILGGGLVAASGYFLIFPFWAAPTSTRCSGPTSSTASSRC